jgi:hypothetical protein
MYGSSYMFRHYIAIFSRFIKLKKNKNKSADLLVLFEGIIVVYCYGCIKHIHVGCSKDRIHKC